jgi:hypothetical protein
MNKVKNIVWQPNDERLLLQEKLKLLVGDQVKTTNYHDAWSLIFKMLNKSTTDWIGAEIHEMFNSLSIIPWEYELWSIFHTGKVSKL